MLLSIICFYINILTMIGLTSSLDMNFLMALIIFIAMQFFPLFVLFYLAFDQIDLQKRLFIK